MKIHRGELANIATRRSGISFKVVADRLECSRSTLYNRFEDENLSDAFLIKLGKVIHYDFARDLPHLKRLQAQENIVDEFSYGGGESEMLMIHRKYYQVLERYSGLVTLLISLLNVEAEELPLFKKKLMKYLEERGDLELKSTKS